MAFNIGSAVAKIKADTTDFQNGIKQVTGSKGLGGVGTLAGKLGPILAGAFAVKKVVDFGASVLKTAGQFEQYQMAFKTMLGSADKANELFNDLKDFAKKTPFNFEEVVKGGKQLLAMGGSAEDVTTELGMLGDVAAGLGVPIERLVYNFGQVRAIGKLTGREVRDFANAGIPLIGALADQFGKTKAEIQEMVSAGEIGFEDVKQAFTGMTSEGGKFYNLMDAQSQTMLGKLSNLQDSWQQFKAVLGDLFIPIATVVVEKLTELVMWIQQAVGEVGSLGSVWLELQSVWESVLMFLQPLLTWFKDNILKDLKAIWAELTYFIKQVIPPVVAIIKFLVFGVIMPIIDGLVNYWRENWDHISKMLKGAWDIIVGIVKLASAIARGIIVVFLNLITFRWKEAWDALKHYTGQAWAAIKQIFGGMISYLSGWGGWLFDKLTEPFRRAWDTIKGIVEKIKSALDFTQRHSPSVVDIVQKGVGLVNKAFEGLQVGVEPIDTQKLAFAGNGIGGAVINIDLAGAYIGDDDIGEKIGDSIIKKLQTNVRF